MFGEANAYCANENCAELATVHLRSRFPLCDKCEDEQIRTQQERRDILPSPSIDSSGLDAAGGDDVLTDREVSCHGPGGIDAMCDRLINQFGLETIDQKLLQRLQEITAAPLHPFLTTGLVCAGRSLHELLDAYEEGHSFYLYTGRGPSDGMHLGHLVPFLFTAYLQRAFDVPCVIQLTDDEKFLYKNMTIAETERFLGENIKDIIACGFHPAKTYIFSNFEAMGALYPQICSIQRHLTCNQIRATFGVEGTDSPAKMAFPAVQMAPAFSSTFSETLFGGRQLRCLVPCGLDQDPYFRLTRDVAQKMGEYKPACISSKFLPALAGIHGKMSSSGDDTILLDDTPKAVLRKLQGAFSGGQETLELQQAKGAELSKDVALRYLHALARVAYPEDGGPDPAALPARKPKVAAIFQDKAEAEGYSVSGGQLSLERGDLAAIDHAYGNGDMLTAEVKKLAAGTISEVLKQHTERRSLVTDEVVAQFKRARLLC